MKKQKDRQFVEIPQTKEFFDSIVESSLKMFLENIDDHISMAILNCTDQAMMADEDARMVHYIAEDGKFVESVDAEVKNRIKKLLGV